MNVSKVRSDKVFDGYAVFPDGTQKLPPGYTFALPPAIPDGYHAVLISGKWRLVVGDAPTQTAPQPTIEEIRQKIYDDIVEATQARLDSFAQTRGYDGILSACSYVPSTVEKFRIEAEYCVQSRDVTWQKLYDILDDVQTGTRPMPSGYSDIENELPELTWPNN